MWVGLVVNMEMPTLYKDWHQRILNSNLNESTVSPPVIHGVVAASNLISWGLNR